MSQGKVQTDSSFLFSWKTECKATISDAITSFHFVDSLSYFVSSKLRDFKLDFIRTTTNRRQQKIDIKKLVQILPIFMPPKNIESKITEILCNVHNTADRRWKLNEDGKTYLVSVNHWWNKLACFANSLRNLSFSSWRYASLANSPSRSSMIFCKFLHVSSNASIVNQVYGFGPTLKLLIYDKLNNLHYL